MKANTSNNTSNNTGAAPAVTETSTLNDAGTILALRTNAALDAVTTFFGRSPDDVIVPMKIAEDALEWIEELFYTMGQLAEEAEESPYNLVRIQKLSSLGRYLASDHLNTLAGEKERMEDSIKSAMGMRGAA